MRRSALLSIVAVAVMSAGLALADTLSVAEIGSFHVGGRAVSLSGLPTRDVVFTAGSAPIKVDPSVARLDRGRTLEPEPRIAPQRRRAS
jgi:hypothetical protein